MTPLATVLRSALLHLPEVSRLTSLKRSTSLFSQGQAADSLYFIEDGLVKLTRTNDGGHQIILAVAGPSQVVGEEVLSDQATCYYSHAEVLSGSATICKIPRGVLQSAIASNASLGNSLVDYLLQRKLALAQKVELLCLHDVEFRILHYLAELSLLVTPVSDGDPHQLPITQLELADLIGATRETTSTTLNQLERRGLVKLSRRLLSIPNPESLRDAARARHAMDSPTPAVVNGVAAAENSL